MCRKAFFICIGLLLSAAQAQAAPTFNKVHGMCKSPFLLRIKGEEAGSVVRYTLDGSEPTAESPQFTVNLYVKNTTIVRAAEFRDGVICSDVATASYIFPADVLEQPALPEGYPETWGSFTSRSGVAPADYEMDPELTSDRIYAQNIKNAFYSIPALSIVTEKGNLFNKEKDELTGGIYIYTGTTADNGRGWERPASIELMGGGHDLSTTCALEMHGGQGRVPEKNPKHSFRLTFKDEYGSKTLRYPLYGEECVARFNSLIVRTFYNYSWIHSDATQRSRAQYGRDLWARQMQKRMGYSTSDGLYVNVFINGLYWGLYNLSERIDDNYCKYHFGGLKADYDVVKREDYLEAAEGTLDKWNELMRLSESAASSETYRAIIGETPKPGEEKPEVRLDVDNFIDYMLINHYAGNNDWDHHNWIALNNREDSTWGFRFVCWDSEQTLFSASKNVLDVKNKDCPTYLFQNLMKNAAFKHRYIDRAYKHLEDAGGLLRPQQAQALWDSLQSIISLSVYAESARWGDYRKDVHPSGTSELYRADVHHANENRRLHEEFFPKRTETLISQLKKKGWYAKTAAPAFLLNGKEVADGDTILLTDRLTLEQGSYIIYTTDGSQPVSWMDNAEGEETSGSALYGLENIAPSLTPGPATLRAISRDGSQWSATISRNVYVMEEEDPTFATAPAAVNAGQPGLYNIAGQRLVKPQGRGVYLKNGNKYAF